MLDLSIFTLELGVGSRIASGEHETKGHEVRRKLSETE